MYLSAWSLPPRRSPTVRGSRVIVSLIDPRRNSADAHRLYSVCKHLTHKWKLMGQECGTIGFPSAIPLVGYELMGIVTSRVNPTTQEIEKVLDGEVHLPYLV